MTIAYQSAVIMVEEMVVSREFYEGLLGQQVMTDHGQNVVFVGGLSLWEFRHAHEIIFNREPEVRAPLGRDNLELYFESEDIEADYERLSNAGIGFIQGIHEEPWAQRTFRCYDPDGHIVEVGEPMPAVIKRLSRRGMTPEDIAERIHMPMEVVLQAIGYPRFC